MLALPSSSHSQARRDILYNTRTALVGDSKDLRSKRAQCRKAHPPGPISVLFPMSQASVEAYLYSECFVVKEKQWVKKPERGS